MKATFAFALLIVLSASCDLEWRQDSAECVRWDRSWKTCNEEGKCTSCEDHMYLDVGSMACKFWEEGQYYDKQADNWKSCEGSCLGNCAYQKHCFVWPAQQYYSLEQMKCIDSWNELILEVDLISYWKMNVLYVDPESPEILELGTYEFPFTSLSAAFLQILNYYSNTNTEVEVLVKEGTTSHLQDDMIYILNITAIKMATYSTLNHKPEKATLILQSDPDDLSQGKSQFFLHSGEILELDKQLQAGRFSEKEVSSARRGVVSIFLLRSNFEMRDFILFRSHKDLTKGAIFLFVNYLQTKSVTMQNISANITGTFLFTVDPFNGYFDNISFDLYKLEDGFQLSTMCNYPEANKANQLFYNQINVLLSHPREYFLGRTNIIYQSGSGNETVTNSDFSKYYAITSETSASVSQIIYGDCVPIDDLLQQFILRNSTFSLKGTKLKTSLTNYFVLAWSGKYRKGYWEASGNKIMDYEKHEYMISDFFGFYYVGTSADTVKFTDNFFANIDSLNYLPLAYFQRVTTVFIENMMFVNGTGIETFAVNFINVNEIFMKNVTFRNYTYSNSTRLPYISIVGTSTRFEVDTLSIQRSDMEQVSLIRSDYPIGSVRVSHVIIEDILHSGDSPLILFYQVKSFNFFDQKYTNVKDADGGIVSGILVNSIDLDSDMNSTITQTSIRDWYLGFFKLNSVVNSLPLPKQILISELNFTDSLNPSPVNILEFGNIQFDGELHMMFDRLNFNNISYASGGYLLFIQHQLSTELVITNSKFTNWLFTGILIESSNKQNTHLKTRVTFNNATFDSINGKLNSVITLRRGGYLTINNSTFTNLSNYYSGAVLYAGSSETTSIISNSVFMNNSASEGAVFFIESKSKVQCYNWTFSNNFSLTGWVVSTVGAGHFEFYDSIITRNYAISNPIALMIESTTLSKLNNCSIHNNGGLSRSNIKSQLIDGQWSELWFVSSDFIQNSYLVKESSIQEKKELLQLIFSSIAIENSTKFYNETLLLNAFVSSVKISGCLVSDISYESHSIVTSLSNLTISDSKFERISADLSSSFILSILENNIEVSNVEVKDSSTVFLSIRTSKIAIDGMKLTSLHSKDPIIEIDNCNGVRLRNLSIFNCSSADDFLFYIGNSQVDLISDSHLSSIGQTVFRLHNSNVSSLEGIDISDSYKAFYIDESIIGMISKWKFANNGEENSTGGAIMLFNSKANFSECEFFNNTAKEGGAISFSWTSLDNCDLNLSNSQFVDNSVSIKGGAIYYDYRRPTFDLILFKNNSAMYGNDIASYPVKIRMNNSDSDDVLLTDVGSNLLLYSPLVLKAVDFDGQTMVLDSYHKVSIQTTDRNSSSVNGFNSGILKNGVVTFDGIKLAANPGSQNVTFHIIDTAIDQDKITKVFGGLLSTNKIRADFRYWRPGEFQNSKAHCVEWTSGQYSFEWNSTSWNKCKDKATWAGGTSMFIDEAYWRRTSNSTQPYKCQNVKACLGGFIDRPEYPTACKRGYRGALCKEWEILDGEKYQKVSSDYWVKCPGKILNALRFTALCLLVLSFIFVLVFINIKKNEESELSTLFRVLINYFQLTWAWTSISFNYPTFIRNLFSPIEKLGTASDTLLGFDWFADDHDIKGSFPSTVLLKLFLTPLLPFIIFTIFTVIWVAICLLKKQWMPNLKGHLLIMLVTIIFSLHPKIVDASISIFKWVEIDKNVHVVDIDTNIECYSNDHIKWMVILGFPSIFVYIFLLPITAFILLKRSIHKGTQNSAKKSLLILYQGVKKKCFYWEFVNTIRKTAVVFSFFLDTWMRVLVTVVILVMTIRIQISVKPYKEEKINLLEISAVYAALPTLCSALVFQIENSNDNLNILIVLIIIAFHSNFLFNWLRFLLRRYRDKVEYIKE